MWNISDAFTPKTVRTLINMITLSRKEMRRGVHFVPQVFQCS